MYKITCFCPLEPTKLESLLKGIGFSSKKDGLEWYFEDIVFRIEPFKGHSNQREKGYRVYFNGNNTMSFAYMFDLSLGTLNTTITCIEYMLREEGKNSNDWLSLLDNNPSIITIDTRGFYQKNSINIIVTNNTVVFQLRSKKNTSLKLISGLKRIEELVEYIIPTTYDLFSFEEELA